MMPTRSTRQIAGAPGEAMTPDGVPIPEWIREHLEAFGPDGLVCVDGSGAVLGFNRGLVRILDTENPETWLLQPLTRVVNWQEPGQPAALFAEASEKGSARVMATVHRSDEVPLPCELTATRASAPGQPNCYFLQVRLAADAVAVQRQLMELQIQHRMLLNRAGGLVLLLDPRTGAVLHANEGAQEYLRLPMAAIRGASVEELLGGLEALAGQETLSAFLDPAVREVELNIPSASGASHVLQMSGNSVSWNGRTALLWVGRDVSDRRAAAPNAETGAPSSGPMVPAAMVLPLAEEVRRPAAQIERVTRHCLDHPEWPWRETRKRLENILELSDEARSSAQDLLYLARLSAGSLDVRRTEITVGNVVGVLVPGLQRIARGRGGDLLTVQVDEDATLYTDPRLLLHALRRFIERALGFDEITVTITAATEGDCIRFTVIDNAPALPAFEVEQVLAEDGLVKAATDAAHHPGLLSLKLAVHLIRAIGGHPELMSSEGMGTRVSLTLRT